MKRKLVVIIVMLLSLWGMTACSSGEGVDAPLNSPTIEPGEDAQVELTEEPVVTSTEQVPVEEVTTTQAPGLSFNAEVFVEESAGVQFSYPTGWTVGPREVIGERGAQAALLSPGSTLEQLADGGTRIILTTYQWDPSNHLEAYITQRKQAWEASGFNVLGEEAVSLADGRKVQCFTVETADGNQVVFAFLNAGEDYLQVSGDGDLELALEIIRTIAVVD